MFVRDIMTTNVVTIPSNTSVIDAKRLLAQKKLRRAPVVERGRLVGIITTDRLDKTGPREFASAGNLWDIAYAMATLHQTTVKEVMQKNVVTVRPEMTVEEAVALAQSKRVGCLVVIEDTNKIAGMVTTNDFFYKIANPVLGIGQPGCRIEITGGGETKALGEIFSTIGKHNLEITTLQVIKLPNAAKKDLVVHLGCENVSQLVDELKSKGYKAELRKR